jgi:anti-sigma factor RsiW
VNLPESHLAQEAIVAYVDRELSGGASARADRHLARCAQCRTAVQAQREAKEALHASVDVAVPGDLLSRLCAIPFTADVGGGDPLRGLAADGPDSLTTGDAGAGWSVSLAPRPATRPGEARWLRFGVLGALAGVGVGLGLLVAGVAQGDPPASSPGTVAQPTSPQERTAIVPPVVRTVTVGSTAALQGGTP